MVWQVVCEVVWELVSEVVACQKPLLTLAVAVDSSSRPPPRRCVVEVRFKEGGVEEGVGGVAGSSGVNGIASHPAAPARSMTLATTTHAPGAARIVENSAEKRGVPTKQLV